MDGSTFFVVLIELPPSRYNHNTDGPMVYNRQQKQMKKSLLAITMALYICSAWAQSRTGEVQFRGDSYPPFIPKEFSQDGKAKFLDKQVGGYSSAQRVYVIYNDNFTSGQQVSIPGAPYTVQEYNWETEEYETKTHYEYSRASYFNLDATGAWYDVGNEIPLTQTLFNSNSKYEYIVPELDNDAYIIALKIMSDDGTLISTINADDGHHIIEQRIVKWNDSYYLMLMEGLINGEEDSYSFVFFRINQATQSISRVEGSLPLSVFPSVADRSQTITIELGEGNNATEIQVVNAAGQVVKSIPVQPGQRVIQLPTTDLGSGVHVIGARSGRSQGACKVIIK